MKFHGSSTLAGPVATLLLLTVPSCGRKASEPPAATAAAGPTQAQADGPAPVQAAQPSAVTAPAPVQAPQPAAVTVPAGTHLRVVLGGGLATDKDRAGDPWEGTLAEAVKVGGQVAWPRGAAVRGVVTQSAPAGRLNGAQGGLGIRVRSVAGQDVKTGAFSVVGASRAARNTKIIGGTAALGALVGILSSHGHQADHALGGAAIGAAAGTGVAAGTADTIIRIPAGKVVVFALTAPGEARQNP
jgi:hypothetical protein